MGNKLFFIGDRGPYFYNDSLSYNRGTPWTFTGGAGAVAFVALSGATPPTITDSGSGFMGGTYDMLDGDIVRVKGTISNNGIYQVGTATAGTLSLGELVDLTAETPSGVVTIEVISMTALVGAEILVLTGPGSDVPTVASAVVTGDITVAPDEDCVLLCSGTLTVTLSASDSSENKIMHIKNIGTGIVTVDGNALETIDGGLTAVLKTRYENICLFCDGSNWHVL